MSDIAEWDRTETLIRDYWLGRIVSVHLDEFENTWFGSDESVEIVEAVRDDLIQDFLGDELSTQDKAAFTNHFLSSPAHARMLAVAGAYQSLAASGVTITVSENATQPDAGFFEGISAFLGSLVPRPAQAFAYSAGLLLIIGFATVLYLRRDNATPETARIDTPANFVAGTPAEPQRTPAAAIEPVNTTPKKVSNSATKENETPNERPKLSVLAFHLTAGTRSNGELGNTIELNDNFGTVKLSVLTPGIDGNFQKYVATIKVYKGKTILIKELPDLSNIRIDSPLTVEVPAKLLRNGTYVLDIVGKRNDGEDKNLLSQSFDVKR